jgi:hypothetical protein
MQHQEVCTNLFPASKLNSMAPRHTFPACRLSVQSGRLSVQTAGRSGVNVVSAAAKSIKIHKNNLQLLWMSGPGGHTHTATVRQPLYYIGWRPHFRKKDVGFWSDSVGVRQTLELTRLPNDHGPTRAGDSRDRDQLTLICWKQRPGGERAERVRTSPVLSARGEPPGGRGAGRLP